jgi:benzodiazapine receptor
MNLSDESWYEKLPKSSLTPPSWVFGVVWPILYILMAVSFGLYVVTPSTQPATKTLGYVAFGIQLVTNIMWPIVFFRWKSILGAFIVIVLNWISLGSSVYLFYRVRPLAGALLVPNFIWVSFAMYLNGYLLG